LKLSIIFYLLLHLMKTPKIIATIGPSCVDRLQELQDAGVDVFRINFSHGEKPWHKEQVEKIRALKKPSKIMLDTKGPEIRTGVFEGEISVKEGGQVILVNKEAAQKPENNMIFCTYLDLPTSVKPDDIIMFDNGQFSGKVLSVHQSSVVVEILSDGTLSSRRHINLPGVRINLPTISKKDAEDISFGKELGVDMIALSFTRTAKDVRQAREIAGDQIAIAAKIENQEGVNNCKSIAREADGIMIARGDLGVELPIHHIPVVQRKMLHDIQTIPETFSIVATGLLRSMKHETRPRRAEVSDIATAVWEGADYLMVSDETASSEHPVKAIEILKDTIDFSIKHGPKKPIC
jgi:pyruvate kinase